MAAIGLPRSAVKVFPVDAEDIAEGNEEVRQLQFRPPNIHPCVERVFINAAGGFLGGTYSDDITCNQLYIEDPPAEKRIAKEAAGSRPHAKKLCSTLRIVNRQTQQHGDDRGKHPAGVVPYSPALDAPA